MAARTSFESRALPSGGFAIEKSPRGGEPALAIDPVLAGRSPLTPNPSPPQSRGGGEPGSESFTGQRSGALPEKH